uniref:Uncharacterized protein n=1 Tax=Anopheles albimanus TaxID=7167 RepID=A0A182FD85_ANOAL
MTMRSGNSSIEKKHRATSNGASDAMDDDEPEETGAKLTYASHLSSLTDLLSVESGGGDEEIAPKIFIFSIGHQHTIWYHHHHLHQQQE